MINYDKLLSKVTFNDNVLSGPGTDQLGDLLITLDFMPNKQGNHSGCAKAARYIWDKYKDQIDHSKPVILQGHSMFGDICVEFAKICFIHGVKTNFEKIKGCYPTSNKETSYYYMKGEIEEYGNDPVTSLFSWLYKHPVEIKHVGPKRTKLGVLKQWFLFPFGNGDHMEYFKDK